MRKVGCGSWRRQLLAEEIAVRLTAKMHTFSSRIFIENASIDLKFGNFMLELEWSWTAFHGPRDKDP